MFLPPVFLSKKGFSSISYKVLSIPRLDNRTAVNWKAEKEKERGRGGGGCAEVKGKRSEQGEQKGMGGERQAREGGGGGREKELCGQGKSR